MVSTRKKQIEIWLQKQNKLLNNEPNLSKQEHIAMMMLGFINGLRLTNSITKTEYNQFYDQIKKYTENIDAA